jgi:carbon-monoxide dehydrogenase medium subunit
MKPPPFEYAAPSTVEEALSLLNGSSEEARALAGGQSLVPLLNMRFARPTLLVDLGHIASLDGIEQRNGHARIGAMTRQRVLETDPGIRDRFPLLAEAAELIAHVAIRTRGTVGGSLAHADPAAELPPATIVLGARFVIRAADGTTRTVPATEFFLGPFTTAVEAGELLEAVELDAPPPGTGTAFVELARVHGAFALVGVAALVGLDSRGYVERARVALCGSTTSWSASSPARSSSPRSGRA